MKSLIQAVAVAAVLVVPVASFAQSTSPANSPVTRAQVRAEIVQLAQVGYRVGYGDNVHYPENIQVAEARVAALNGAGGYGGVAGGTSQAGGCAAAPATGR